MFQHLDRGDTMPADVPVESARAEDFAGLVLPGGVANPDQLRADPAAVAFAGSFFTSGRPVAVICHGPAPAGPAGLLLRDRADLRPRELTAAGPTSRRGKRHVRPAGDGSVVPRSPARPGRGRLEQMSATPQADRLKLPHGYTNATTRSAGVVRKAGWHGQDALEDDRHAPAVLRLCGQLRRRLSGIGPATVPGLPGSGEVIVHGDFGPQNLLLSSDAHDVLAVVDWEWCHLGSAVEDLAWAEWIVRMHHQPAVPHLGELFAGYGIRPAWHERKEAMLRMCRRYREFSRRSLNPDAICRWEERTAITQAFRQ